MSESKHIVITSGSSGLGVELARMPVDEGASLTLMARDTAKLEHAAVELRQRKARASVKEADD